MAKLTKRVVDAAAVREKDYFIWDDELPGFGLRVFASGKRSYELGLGTANSQAFLNLAWPGNRLLVGGIAVVDAAGENPIDNSVVRLETDLLFADGFD